MVCGKHGFSVRDGGFRFDVDAGTGLPPHPQAHDPLVIEDPVNMINNIASTCYKAQSVQRAFVEAANRLQAVSVRHRDMEMFHRFAQHHPEMTCCRDSRSRCLMSEIFGFCQYSSIGDRAAPI